MNHHLKSSFFIGITLVGLMLIGSCKSAPAATDPNFLGNYPPRELGIILGNSVPQNKTTLIPREISFLFYPNGNNVEMSFRDGMNFITLPLTEMNRKNILDAMSVYIAEYQSGKLNTENSKKKAYFGSTRAFISWGLLAPTYYAIPELRFEYQILENNKPYFFIANATSPETTVDGYPVRDGAGSPALRIAFSPIQCQNMIEMLNQDALLKIVSDLDAEAALFDIPAEAAASGTDGAPVKPKELF